MPKTSTVVLGTTNISIERNPVGSNVPEVIALSQIVGVTGIYNAKPGAPAPGAVDERTWWNYRFNTMTVLQLDLADGRRTSIELQEVSNKPTWNLGTQAALQTAITDIQAALP